MANGPEAYIPSNDDSAIIEGDNETITEHQKACVFLNYEDPALTPQPGTTASLIFGYPVSKTKEDYNFKTLNPEPSILESTEMDQLFYNAL